MGMAVVKKKDRNKLFQSTKHISDTITIQHSIANTYTFTANVHFLEMFLCLVAHAPKACATRHKTVHFLEMFLW